MSITASTGNRPFHARAPILVLMGVSGSGKSTVALALADRLGWDLAEGDEMHSAANVAKMAAGQPLTDADRSPWLARIAAWIRAETDAGRSGIVTCSALKRDYRDRLRGDNVVFVYLKVPREILAQRLAARAGHYMPTSLLKSQLAALEEPGLDELAITVDVAGGIEQTVRQVEEGITATTHHERT